MRKLTSVEANATALLQVLPPSPLIARVPSSSPTNNYYGHGMFLFSAISILDSAFDITTLSIIFCLILFSSLSLSFIFHLHLKSRRAYHLQNFNSLWSVRLLLVSFVAFWALNEILHLPFFYQRYLYPFFPSLTLSEQTNICKIHVVLSLGFFEPGFLISLLFLVDVSIKKRSPQDMWAMGSIILNCLPVFMLQVFFVFFSPLKAQLPDVFHVSYVLSIDPYNNKILMCTYPLFSIIVFAAFGIVYSLGFLFSYWKVVSLVINKGTRVRIHVLAFSVLVALPMQVLFLALSSFWRPDHHTYRGAMLGMFVSVSFCAVVGEGILVIKPIVDALATGGHCLQYNTSVELRLVQVRRREMVDVNQ
ncbi:hypothetical protein ACSBR2_008594 [Camellia fascicularis]